MYILKINALFFLVIILFSVSTLAVPPNWPKDGVIVEPDMNRAPLIAVFQEAKHSLKLSAYRLTDKRLIAELCEAVKRGVEVELLVTRDVFKSGEKTPNDETPMKLLKELGINVHQSPKFYDQAHHKMILVDDLYALIGTPNMGKNSFDDNKESKAQRGFWVTVTDKNQLKELKNVFTADFNGEKTNLKNSLLVWSPDQGRAPFIKLIHSAKNSLWIYQPDIEDEEIACALAEAARKGIDVRLIMPPFPYSKTKDANIPNQEMIRDAGGKVGLITHVVGHAKVILVDVGTKLAKAWVGSVNFYPPSLDRNRELGIITSHLPTINKISSVFEVDWGQANFTARK